MKTRIIQTRFWKDDFISKLNVEAKLVFLYLITNESIGLTGIYEEPIPYIAFHCGLNNKKVEKALDDLKDKIVYFKGWIVVKNAIKYNNYASNSKQRKAYMKEYEKIPDALKRYIPYYKNVDKYSPKYISCGSSGYKHRKIAEKILKRKLKKNEVVHHIDHNPSNNSINNLAVMSKKSHKLLHRGKLDLYDSSIILLSDYSDSRPNIKYKNKKPKIRNKKKEYSKVSVLDKESTIKHLEDLFPSIGVREEIDKMKDWLASNGKHKKDYIAFARNWLRKAVADTLSIEKFQKKKSVDEVLAEKYKDYKIL